MFDLQRFIKIQNENYNYEQALTEIQSGQKRSHWIWYIFPQIQGLGKSYMSQMYGIDGKAEAELYLADSMLSARLREITNAVLESDSDANVLMGSRIDAVKLKSSMTLFDAVSPNDIFGKVLDKFFNGERDEKTLELIK